MVQIVSPDPIAYPSLISFSVEAQNQQFLCVRSQSKTDRVAVCHSVLFLTCKLRRQHPGP
eukprot:750947-Prorocentrum_lima.AAC.1